MYMKHISILLACIAIALGANAQKVTFLYNGQPVEKDAVITSNVIKETGYSYMFEPNLYLQASAACELYVNANCTTGQEISLCIGQCKNGSDVTTDNFRMAKDAKEEVQFHYESYDPVDYIVNTVFTVFDANTDDAITTLTLTYDPKAGSVKLVTDEQGVNYSNGILSVNGTATVALYDTTGKCVYKADAVSSVSTDGLAKGVYIYRVGEKTGKILVK